MKYKKQLYTISTLILAGLFIWFFSNIFFYILVALVLSLIGNPIVVLLDKLKIGKIHLPHTLNAGIALLLMISTIVVFFMLTIPLLVKQVNTLSNIDGASVETAFNEPISNLEFKLKTYGLIDASNNLTEMTRVELEKMVSKYKLSDLFANILGVLTSAFGAIFIISFVTFFVLRDSKIFYRLLFIVVHEEYHHEIERIVNSTKRLLTRYFVGLILDISIVSSLYILLLWVLGVENALLIGFLAGMVNVIPYIGPFIGASIGLFIGIVSGLPMDFNTDFFPLVVKILSVFIVVNLLDAMVMQPNIYAKSVNAHPLEIFFVIIIAGALAGIPGMILAIPTYSFIRIVAREFFYKYPIVQKLTSSMSKD